MKIAGNVPTQGEARWLLTAQSAGRGRTAMPVRAENPAAALLAPLVVALLVLAAAGARTASAHGAFVEARQVGAVVVEARFDAGDPMAGAQVAVFAPGDPDAPWLLGVADGDGRFIFTPDDQPGAWRVEARRAGHGAAATVTLAGYSAAPPPAGPLVEPATGPFAAAPLQRAVMGACVVWGFVGTALYLRRKGG